MKSLVNKIHESLVHFEKKAGLTDKRLRIATVGVTSLVAAEVAYAQIAQIICRVYNSIFTNELISGLGFVVFAILLCVMLMGDGQREKSALIKFSLVFAALFNIPTLLSYFGASPC